MERKDLITLTIENIEKYLSEKNIFLRLSEKGFIKGKLLDGIYIGYSETISYELYSPEITRIPLFDIWDTLDITKGRIIMKSSLSSNALKERLILDIREKLDDIEPFKIDITSYLNKDDLNKVLSSGNNEKVKLNIERNDYLYKLAPLIKKKANLEDIIPTNSFIGGELLNDSVYSKFILY